MADRPLPGARRFETYVRWSTYGAVALPAASLLGSALLSRDPAGAPVVVWIGVSGLVLALVAGNVLVSRWSVDTVVGRARRPSTGLLAGWGLVLVAIVVVAPRAALPAAGLTTVAAVASAAASVVPALGAYRTAALNALVLVATVLIVGLADVSGLVTGLVLISAVIWTCWTNAWMLRVLLELQAAHDDRAALALAEERLRISRDVHDVLGRTLAAIAVKSSLASELVDRGRTERAAQEIAGIRRIAQEAGTGVRRVVRGEHRASWDDEVAGARSLLESAGIGATVTGDPVPAGCAEALAWVVREAVTNLLRHSAATRVVLTTTREDGAVRLRVGNDGVADGPDPVAGSGLTSLSERLGALGGHLTAHRDGTWFRLDAVVPVAREEQA